MMKKTLVAFAVMAAAGTAQAGISLYDADGVSVSLSGAAEVQYYKSYDETNDATLRMDDGALAVNVAVSATQQVDVLAGISFAFEADNDGDNVANDELYVGFGGDFGALTFGRQLMISDDQGNTLDYELAENALGFDTTEGDRVVKYVFDNGQFYAGASVLLKDSTDGNGDDEVFDGRLGARFGDLDARVYLYSDNIRDGFDLEVDYTFQAFGIAASYGEYESDLNSEDLTAFALAGSYTMDLTTFAVGYVYSDPDAGEDANVLYANVTQQLHNNVKAYAEIGASDADDTDFGYVLGMEVSF